MPFGEPLDRSPQDRLTFTAVLLKSAVGGLCLLLGIGCSETAGVRTTGIVVTVSPTLVIGERRQAEASVTTTQVGVGPSSSVTWESRDESIVRVTAGGEVAAVGMGSADISARADGVTGTARVVVVPSVAGTWTGAIAREACLEPPGCYIAPSRPEVIAGQLTLSQQADRLDGTFLTDSGVPVAVSGLVDSLGVVTLSGEGRKHLDDGRLWISIAIRSWSTTLRDQRLIGEAVTLKQELQKGGETLGALVAARGSVTLQ